MRAHQGASWNAGAEIHAPAVREKRKRVEFAERITRKNSTKGVHPKQPPAFIALEVEKP
jgi:hypothetical protein